MYIFQEYNVQLEKVQVANSAVPSLKFLVK